MTLWPAVPPDVLAELVRERGAGWVFFEPDRRAPTVVADDAFGPVARRAVRALSGLPVSADAPESDEPSLPKLVYTGPTAFPLWRAPGKDET
jgi:hypothetical protein